MTGQPTENGPDESRALVLRFCEHLSRREFDEMAALTTEDASWWVVGRPDKVAYGGARSIAEIMPNLRGFLGSLDSFAFTVTGTTAEGNRVAIEAVSHGRLGAREYRNDYLMQYEIDGGHIRSIREFLDHFEVAAFLES